MEGGGVGWISVEGAGERGDMRGVAAADRHKERERERERERGVRGRGGLLPINEKTREGMGWGDNGEILKFHCQ